jgi:hypothetical protein
MEVPDDRMANLALVEWAPEVGTALLSRQALNSWLLEFQAAPGLVFRSSADLAQLSFLAVSNRSAFVSLLASNITALDTNGRAIPRTLSGPGRVVIIEREPLLEALPLVNGQPNVVLYGIPGHDYDIQSTPVLPASSGWVPVWQGTMPSNSLWMVADGLTNSIAPSLFFRAEDRFGQ